MIRITWPRVLIAGLAALLLGLGFGWSGAFNVGASTGHWAISDWFLHWVMRNSVRTHAWLEDPEPPTDASGLVSAAGHFAASCAVCHGAPGERPSPVMQAAVPPAPDLAVNAREWTDAQLFWILKHGVKFSGMPAWPSQARDDEVRRMAAFVRRLPGMTPATYRALAYGPGGRIAGGTATSLAKALPDCARCHGADGLGRGPDVPVIAGQKPAYLLATLRAYAGDHRASGVMQAAAARVDASTMVTLARHYAALPGLSAAPAGGSLPAARIVAAGLPADRLPACTGCHGPNGRPVYPLLGGQKPGYLAARLRAFRGDEKEVHARQSQAVMPVIARRIPEGMVDTLAHAYAGDAVRR